MAHSDITTRLQVIERYHAGVADDEGQSGATRNWHRTAAAEITEAMDEIKELRRTKKA